MKVFDFACYFTWCAENRMRQDYMNVVFDGQPIRFDCTGILFVAAKGDFTTVYDCWCSDVDEDVAKARQFGRLPRVDIRIPMTLQYDYAEKDGDENVELQQYLAREQAAIF